MVSHLLFKVHISSKRKKNSAKSYNIMRCYKVQFFYRSYIEFFYEFSEKPQSLYK